MQVLAIFVLAALVFSAQAGLTEEQKTKLKSYYDECVTQTGADKELITKARKNDFTEDEKLMKYYECMMYKMGFMSTDGTLHPELMKAKLPESVDAVKGGKIIDECCVKKEGDSNHETAFKIFKCFVSTTGKEVRFW